MDIVSIKLNIVSRKQPSLKETAESEAMLDMAAFVRPLCRQVSNGKTSEEPTVTAQCNIHHAIIGMSVNLREMKWLNFLISLGSTLAAHLSSLLHQ